MISQLKWIAMYESKPVSAIRWIGKIQENGVKPYKNTGKCGNASCSVYPFNPYHAAHELERLRHNMLTAFHEAYPAFRPPLW